ncbi:unnamed protein product [Effrenium voratum]|uniref:Uncharacterized protein n=1 Tax=Effrenium voratum TaxID=2562239 RepID=A0AA36IUG0_9DINO|nr:unnamed protein product [Effrenium voratum]
MAKARPIACGSAQTGILSNGEAEALTSFAWDGAGGQKSDRLFLGPMAGAEQQGVLGATETEMPDFGVLGQDGGSPKSQWQATPVPETEMPDFGAFGQVQEDCFGAWPPVTTWSHWHNLSAYDYSAYCWEGWLGQWPSQPELTAGPIHRSNATRNRRSAKQSQRK